MCIKTLLAEQINQKSVCSSAKSCDPDPLTNQRLYFVGKWACLCQPRLLRKSFTHYDISIQVRSEHAKQFDRRVDSRQSKDIGYDTSREFNIICFNGYCCFR